MNLRPSGFAKHKGNTLTQKSQSYGYVSSGEKLAELALSLSVSDSPSLSLSVSSRCFVVSPASFPSKTPVLYRAAEKLHRSSWRLSSSLKGTLKLEGGESVAHLVSLHIHSIFTDSHGI